MQYGLYKATYDDEQCGFNCWRLDYVFDGIPTDAQIKDAISELGYDVNIRTCRVLLRDGQSDSLDGYIFEKIEYGNQRPEWEVR